ncbi:unnamed protein product [Penicillium salamii]|uniref:Uncharacterized protein n=1 Tax=Penicillium salamii TaxID=1612424 RepID=A0A9W4NS28_9EURO|nr:unnamed protein product [Penicillium salamii]CAG8333945.1 unnamed protein product [Penicillium salamii]CAG8340816.1 unnamed protein product [Penicillium salamii]CAG8382162.1 unnamed protein product [Penicillium salamii]CAG8388154.1 unnamed protein product [Penicillium salamii]
MDSTTHSLPLFTMSTQKPTIDCIKAYQTISPLAHIFLTTRFDHEPSHLQHQNHYVDFIAQSLIMAISNQKSITRVTKPNTTPKKQWTEALKEKLVQYADYQQPVCVQFTNRLKSHHNAILQEALYCTQCKNICTTVYQMRTDIEEGVYVATQYPPYFADKAAPIEEISPFDTTPDQSRNQTFWSNITPSQQRRYFQMVDAIIRKTEIETGQVAGELMVLYAHYQMDTHIRRHAMRTQSVLNICRDKEDVIGLRHWQWEVYMPDAMEITETEPIKTMESPEHLEHEWGVGWVTDPTNSLDQQYEVWKAGESEREQCVKEVRSRWDQILEERREQRERTAIFSFRGVPFQTIKYDPPSEPPLSEEEIMAIAGAFGPVASEE